MKINEKNMCYLATTPPIDLEGWLQKRGEVNKSWQRRYFVLKGNLLFYFEKKGEREPIGVIILEGCTIELAEEGEQYCFQIIFHGINNRTYYLSAETQEIMEQWMRALTCAGYEYMKVMVAELQRQLNEIEKSKDAVNRSIDAPPRPPPRHQSANRQNLRENPFNNMNTTMIQRAAPPPPPTSKTNPSNINTQASNGGGMGSVLESSKQSNANQTPIVNPFDLNASSNCNQKTPKEFNFQTIHETFGREIEQDLRERKRLKELKEMAQHKPLIDL